MIREIQAALVDRNLRQRVKGYAYACAEYLKSRTGAALGFEERKLPIQEMIQATDDRHYISQLELYERLKSILSEGF